MKLTSRDATFDIEDITKTTIGPNDVIVIRADLDSMNSVQRAQFAEAMKVGCKAAFPRNKVVVLDKSVTLTIATVTP